MENTKPILFHPICNFGKILYPRAIFAIFRGISGISVKMAEIRPFSVIFCQNRPILPNNPSPKCQF